VPLDIAFVVQSQLAFGGSVTVGWLFGLVRVRLPPGRPRKEKKPPKPRRKKKRAADSRLARRGLAVLRNAAFRRRVLRFMGRVLRSFRMRDVAVHVRLGLDDPADTGRLWGLAGPAVALLEMCPGVKAELEPSFPNACFEADARGTLRVMPLQLAYVTLMFVLSVPVLRAAGTVLFGDRR